MKLTHPRAWGITARLLLVATAPSFVVLLVGSASLYVAAEKDAQQMLQDRGQLLAALLAKTSEYGVWSNNTAELERGLQRFVKLDPSIAAAAVLDTRRAPIVSIRIRTPTDAIVFERPIGAEVLDIVDVEQGELYSSASGNSVSRSGQVVGLVSIALSPESILKEKRGRLIVGGGLVILLAILTGLAGWYLAQGLRRPLLAVMGSLRRIREGDYQIMFPQRAGGELGELQDVMMQMAKGFSVTRQELEDQVAGRTKELRDAVELATAADADKRKLLARTTALLEEERHRLAVEIHDDLGAALAVVNMQAQRIAALANKPHSQCASSDIEGIAESISSTVKDLYSSAQNIVKRLRPEVIDTLGLAGAVDDMVRHYDQLHRQCSFVLYTTGNLRELRGQLAITCFRIVQEALSNVMKHSGANQAVVKLERHINLPMLTAVVADNGKGFSPNERTRDGLGLIGMNERAASVGGSVSIESVPGKGTTITIRLPLARADFRSTDETPPFSNAE